MQDDKTTMAPPGASASQPRGGTGRGAPRPAGPPPSVPTNAAGGAVTNAPTSVPTNAPARPGDAPQDLAAQLAEMQATLVEIQRELDARRRHAQEMEDLKDDLTRVVRDVLESAVRELDDLTPFVHTGDFSNLVKKLLRNTNRIADGFDKLESAADFVRDATPITHDAFRAAITKLDELERKGYFQLAADLQSTLDALVHLLRVWGVLPAMRAAFRDAAAQGAEGVERTSLWRAYRATKRPEMRYLLGAALGLVGRFAAELRLGRRHAAIAATGEPVAALAE